MPYVTYKNMICDNLQITILREINYYGEYQGLRPGVLLYRYLIKYKRQSYIFCSFGRKI